MKRIFSLTVVLLTVFNIFALLPQTVMADENLTIPEWEVDAKLLETGDLQITEDITFQFEDYFNGVYREIMLNKTSGAADINVDEITEGGPIPYAPIGEAENGDSGVYTIQIEKDKIVLKIFSPSDDESKTFRIRYTIRNVAIRYNDTGELYYKFLGDENATPIGRFQVNLILPQGAEEDRVKVFAHGPLNGVIRKESKTVYSLSVKDVPPNTFVEGRAVFPKELIPLSQNTQSMDNYANILEEEASFQRKLTADLERERQIRILLGQVSIWASVFGLVIFSVFMILFRREKNIYQNEEYDGRSIPEECSPAVAAYLTSTVLSTNTIFATILDLVRRGFVTIQKAEDNSGAKKQRDDYIMTRVIEQEDSLLEHEKHFMNWLFHEIGDDRTVTTRQIETYRNERSASLSSQYYNWRTKVKADAVRKGYYDRSKIALGIILIIGAAAMFFLSIFTLVYENPFGLASMVMSFVLFIYGLILLNRRSDYGYWQYIKWMQFKKYMKSYREDPGNEEIVEEPEDARLIYALGLDIRKSLKDFQLNQSELANESYSYNDWMPWYFIYISSNNSFRRSMNRSFGYSSSGGSSSSGGGFSGGGGGGAGGGGAGGF